MTLYLPPTPASCPYPGHLPCALLHGVDGLVKSVGYLRRGQRFAVLFKHPHDREGCPFIRYAIETSSMAVKPLTWISPGLWEVPLSLQHSQIFGGNPLPSGCLPDVEYVAHRERAYF